MTNTQVIILGAVVIYVAVQIWLATRPRAPINDPIANMTVPPAGSIWCEACNRTGEGSGRNKPLCDHCGGYRTVPAPCPFKTGVGR